MFGRKNRKARKVETAAPAPKFVEVYWRSHITHPWNFLGKFDTVGQARHAADHMTLAQVDIREHY